MIKFVAINCITLTCNVEIVRILLLISTLLDTISSCAYHSTWFDLWKKKRRSTLRLRGQQSNLTRININHSSFTGLFTRPTLQQPPGATLENHPRLIPVSGRLQRSVRSFSFSNFSFPAQSKTRPKLISHCRAFPLLNRLATRFNNFRNMNTGCVLIIWIFFFNIFIWKCKNAHCYVTWLTGNLLIFNYNLHVTLMCCILYAIKYEIAIIFFFFFFLLFFLLFLLFSFCFNLQRCRETRVMFPPNIYGSLKTDIN